MNRHLLMLIPVAASFQIGFAEGKSVEASIATNNCTLANVPDHYRRWGVMCRGDIVVTLGKEHPLLRDSPLFILWYQNLQIPDLLSAESFVDMGRNLFVVCEKRSNGKPAQCQAHWVDKHNRTLRSSPPETIDYIHKINWSGKDSAWKFSYRDNLFEVVCPELDLQHAFDFSQAPVKDFGDDRGEIHLQAENAQIPREELSLGQVKDGDLILSLGEGERFDETEDLIFSLRFHGKKIEDVVDGTLGYKDIGSHVFVLTNVRDEKGEPIVWMSDPVSISKRRVRAHLLNKETQEILSTGPMDSEYCSIKKSSCGGLEDRFTLKGLTVEIVSALTGKEYMFRFDR